MTGLAAASVVLVMAFGILAAPAQAGVWYGVDGDNPKVPAGDVSRIRVDHGARTVGSKVLFHGQGYGDLLRVYYDTRPRDAGPEFVLAVTIIAEAEAIDRWQLRRIESFRQGQAEKGEPVRCRGDRASLTKKGGVYTAIPRRCLASRGKAPRRVRVSVWSWAYDHGPAGETWHDWAPGRMRFGGWARQG